MRSTDGESHKLWLTNVHTVLYYTISKAASTSHIYLHTHIYIYIDTNLPLSISLPCLLRTLSVSVAVLGHTSVGRNGQYTDLVGCVLVPVTIGRDRLTWILGCRHSCRARQDRHPRASGGRPPKALVLLGGIRFITWCLRHPFLREC